MSFFIFLYVSETIFICLLVAKSQTDQNKTFKRTVVSITFCPPVPKICKQFQITLLYNRGSFNRLRGFIVCMFASLTKARSAENLHTVLLYPMESGVFLVCFFFFFFFFGGGGVCFDLFVFVCECWLSERCFRFCNHCATTANQKLASSASGAIILLLTYTRLNTFHLFVLLFVFVFSFLFLA